MNTKIIALSSAILLSGCVTTGPNSISTVVTQIQSTAVNICGYLPEATAVAQIVSIFAGGGVFIGQAEQVAQEICAAAAAIPVTKAGRYGVTRYHTVLVRNISVRVKLVR